MSEHNDTSTDPQLQSENGEFSRNSLPQIERELDNDIHVGAGGALCVPREDIGTDIDVGEDLDLAAMQAKKIRKPQRREWIALRLLSELTVNLLLHKPNPNAIDTDYYYVAPILRLPIRDELKACRVFLYYSFTTRCHALWIINVTPDNSWYESLQALLQQSADFFQAHAIRIMSDKPNSRYRVKRKPLPDPVSWPTMSTELLLGEALGPDKFITSADHPLYRDLIDGIELM